MVTLRKVWAVMDAPAGKQMTPFLPEIMGWLWAFHELDVEDATAAKLCAMSGITIDRRLAWTRLRRPKPSTHRPDYRSNHHRPGGHPLVRQRRPASGHIDTRCNTHPELTLRKAPFRSVHCLGSGLSLAVESARILDQPGTSVWVFSL